MAATIALLQCGNPSPCCCHSTCLQEGASADGRHVSVAHAAVMASSVCCCCRTRHPCHAAASQHAEPPCCTAHSLPCRYFHIFAFFSSVIPLAFGYPAPAVLPSALEAALLLAIACGSFGGNLLVNRAFQLELAAKASAVNFAQVGLLHRAM